MDKPVLHTFVVYSWVIQYSIPSFHDSRLACVVNDIHSHMIALVQTHEAVQDLLSAYKGQRAFL